MLQPEGSLYTDEKLTNQSYRAIGTSNETAEPQEPRSET